jgi:hypothetical protein
VNATRSPPKATNWSGIKNGKSSKEIKLSWYQSIDKEHFWDYVKFEVGLSIPFTRKMGSKKLKLFPRSVLILKWSTKNYIHAWVNSSVAFFKKSAAFLWT